jgi:hypothetical protein
MSIPWKRSLAESTSVRGEESTNATGDDQCTKHRADVKCTSAPTWRMILCDYRSTGEIMRCSSEFDLCRSSAIMSTEDVPNGTENDFRTRPKVISKRDRKSSPNVPNHLPNGITSDSHRTAP